MRAVARLIVMQNCYACWQKRNVNYTKDNAIVISVAPMAVASTTNVNQSGATSVLKRTHVLQTRTVAVIVARTTNAKRRGWIVSYSYHLLSKLTNAIVPRIVIHRMAVAVWMDLVVLALKVNIFLHIEPILYYEN